MPNEPSVWILVLNYCSLDDTLGCVDSVRMSDYSSFRLLVIDNASPDGSGAVLSNRIPSREFMQLPRNTGYAGGNNIGIARALREGADYIMIANPDVRLSADTISKCVAIMEQQPSIGALNPIQLDGTGFKLDEKFRLGIFVRHGFPEPSLQSGGMQLWDTNTLYGAALVLSRTALDRAGGFDPLFFAYGEEEDLARRILRKGMRLVVTTAGPVRHLRTKESSVSDFVLFLRIKGLYLSVLKDPTLGFLRALLRLSRDMRQDLMGRRADQYPFKQFPVGRRHVVKAIFWITLRLPLIYAHRHLDSGASYLPHA